MKMPIDFTKKKLLGCMNLAEFGSGERQELDVIGWENRPRTFPGIPVTDTNWRIRMRACCVRAGELNCWIGRQFDEIARWTPVVSPELVGLLGTLHDESACLLEQIPAGEVGVCPIGQIKARAGQHLIENTDVVTGTGGRINIGRNAAGAIEKIEHSDHTVGEMGRHSSNYPESRNGGGRNQREDGQVLRNAARFAAKRFAILECECLRRRANDMPVAGFVDALQKVAQHAVVKFRTPTLQWSRARRSLDVASTLSASELCESKIQKLARAGDASYFAIPPEAIHAAREFDRGTRVCPPNKDLSVTFKAPRVGQLRSSPSVGVIFERLHTFVDPIQNSQRLLARCGFNDRKIIKHMGTCVWNFNVFHAHGEGVEFKHFGRTCLTNRPSKVRYALQGLKPSLPCLILCRG
ncbi:MAG: hypothetical protein JWN92_891 [Candidatus Acidoferrum typicum]|nr:hypothetical protein [Candidatus Acidoferrum typicum]